MSQTKTRQIQQIDVDAIEANPYQPRRIFDDAEMVELVTSIRDHGLLQPILVRPLTRGRYQIVAGERRWRAIKDYIGWLQIDAVVKPMSAVDAGIIALIENGQRKDPDDWGTALSMKKIMQEGELSKHALARKLGKSLGYVNNFIDLFKLKPDVQAMVQKNEHVRSSAFEIDKVADKETRTELIELVSSGAGFKAVKAQVEQHLSDVKWKRDSQKPDSHSRNGNEIRQQREAYKEIRDGLSNIRRGLTHIAQWSKRADPGHVQQVQHEIDAAIREFNGRLKLQ